MNILKKAAGWIHDNFGLFFCIALAVVFGAYSVITLIFNLPGNLLEPNLFTAVGLLTFCILILVLLVIYVLTDTLQAMKMESKGENNED